MKKLSKDKKKLVLIVAAVIVSSLVIYGVSTFAGQTASSLRARIVRQALSRKGKPTISYGRRGTGGWGPNKFHSPGLVWWSHVTAGNSYMRRVGKGTVARYARLGKRTTRIRNGDLMFFKQPGSRSRRPVMIGIHYASGSGRYKHWFIYASSACSGVNTSSLYQIIECNNTRRTYRESYLFTKNYVMLPDVQYLRPTGEINNSEDDGAIDEAEMLKEN